jgi:hypothetical protein
MFDEIAHPLKRAFPIAFLSEVGGEKEFILGGTAQAVKLPSSRWFEGPAMNRLAVFSVLAGMLSPARGLSCTG